MASRHNLKRNIKMSVNKNANILEKVKELPVVVGITGHRNVVKDDYPVLCDEIRKGLLEIKELCKTKYGEAQTAPITMLTGLAQGADILGAKVARELGIQYVAVLPCELEKFKKSFDDEDALRELDGYVANALEVVVVDDIEKAFENQSGRDEDSYRYRQVGIYIVPHSSLLVAMWDGKPPKSKFGCGTTDVVSLALDNDCPVMWIRCRRAGDGSKRNVTRSYLLPPNKYFTAKTKTSYCTMQ